VLTLSQGISPKGYMQIDDADVLSSDLIEELDEIIETPRFGTVIMTVKDLHIIPAWVQSRCEKIQLLFPNAQQFVRRAHAILHAEGLRITANDVESLLTGFDGNWWDFLRLLESHVIKNKP
jgi:DNA polymerase III delta prime subunit